MAPTTRGFFFPRTETTTTKYYVLLLVRCVCRAVWVWRHTVPTPIRFVPIILYYYARITKLVRRHRLPIDRSVAFALARVCESCNLRMRVYIIL